MNNIFHLIRKYPFSCCIIAIVWVICLIPVPETPLSDVKMIDKWTHVVMNLGVCGVIWMEYMHRHSSLCHVRVIMGAVIAPAVMGGVIELAQAYCTGGRRSGDWYDVLADLVGVALATLIFYPLAVAYFKYRKN